MKKRYQPYEEKFIRFSNFMEQLLKKLIFLFIILLIIIQLLLLNDRIRVLLVPVEKIEGTFEEIQTLLWDINIW